MLVQIHSSIEVNTILERKVGGIAKVALKKDKKAEKEGGGRRQGEQGGRSCHLGKIFGVKFM